MNKPKLTREQEQEIAHALLGTCETGVFQAEEYEVELQDIEEACLNQNVERCPVCDWWCESSELIDEEGNVVGCDQCRPEEIEDLQPPPDKPQE